MNDRQRSWEESIAYLLNKDNGRIAVAGRTLQKNFLTVEEIMLYKLQSVPCVFNNSFPSSGHLSSAGRATDS